MRTVVVPQRHGHVPHRLRIQEDSVAETTGSKKSTRNSRMRTSTTMQWMQLRQHPGSNQNGGGPRAKEVPHVEPKVVHQGVAGAARVEKETTAKVAVMKPGDTIEV